MNLQSGEDARAGREHANLEGSKTPLPFRPRRVQARELSRPPLCLLSGRDELEVVNLTSAGVAVTPPSSGKVTQGQLLQDVLVHLDGTELWGGPAEVVHVDTEHGAVGLRFLEGRIDMNWVQLRDNADRTLRDRIQSLQEADCELPQSWRAGVAQLRHLLNAVRQSLQLLEENLRGSDHLTSIRAKDVCGSFYETWWPLYRDRLLELDGLSAQLPRASIDLARAYASAELMPLLEECPVHGRAFRKPLGYAGDYLLMVLGQAESLSGGSLFGRFLHYVAQNYPLGLAISARSQAAAETVLATISKQQPIKIVSLASGPAIELQKVLHQMPVLEHGLELVLVDQDEDAIRHAHAALEQIICQRTDRRLIKMNCINSSISQLMTPSSSDQKAFLMDQLGGADFIYSMGLFDYLDRVIAIRLLRRLYALLGAGGRLFVGNLRREPCSSWVMDYAVYWQLVYREESDMVDLGAKAFKRDATVSVSRDDTGLCLFLDVERLR